MPTIEEIKLYLGIDGGWLDPLLADLLKLAQGLIEKVLRYPLTEFEEIPPTIKESAKFIVSSYYHNKENTNAREVENTVALLLSEYRKVGF